MVRKQLTITIEKDILKKYKEFCEKNDINISKRIERYIKKDMEK